MISSNLFTYILTNINITTRFYQQSYFLYICNINRCLVHLSRHSAEVSIFAPDKPQLHVVNHLKGEPMEGETR